MITGFEPRTSGVRKNHSTTKVTTTAQRSFKAGRFRTFYNCIKQSKLLSKWQLHVTGFFCVDSTALPKYRTAKVPHCQSFAANAHVYLRYYANRLLPCFLSFSNDQAGITTSDKLNGRCTDWPLCHLFKWKDAFTYVHFVCIFKWVPKCIFKQAILHLGNKLPIRWDSNAQPIDYVSPLLTTLPGTYLIKLFSL